MELESIAHYFSNEKWIEIHYPLLFNEQWNSHSLPITFLMNNGIRIHDTTFLTSNGILIYFPLLFWWLMEFWNIFLQHFFFQYSKKKIFQFFFFKIAFPIFFFNIFFLKLNFFFWFQGPSSNEFFGLLTANLLSKVQNSKC